MSQNQPQTVEQSIINAIRKCRPSSRSKDGTPSGANVAVVGKVLGESSTYLQDLFRPTVETMLGRGELALVANYLDPDKGSHRTNFVEVGLESSDLPHGYDMSKNAFAVDDLGNLTDDDHDQHRYIQVRLYVVADGLPATARKALRRDRRGVLRWTLKS